MNEINFLADEIHQPLTKLMIIIKMFTESYLIDPINEIPQTDKINHYDKFYQLYSNQLLSEIY